MAERRHCACLHQKHRSSHGSFGGRRRQLPHPTLSAAPTQCCATANAARRDRAPAASAISCKGPRGLVPKQSVPAHRRTPFLNGTSLARASPKTAAGATSLGSSQDARSGKENESAQDGLGTRRRSTNSSNHYCRSCVSSKLDKICQRPHGATHPHPLSRYSASHEGSKKIGQGCPLAAEAPSKYCRR